MRCFHRLSQLYFFHFIGPDGGTYTITIDQNIDSSAGAGTPDKGNLEGAVGNLGTVVKGIGFVVHFFESAKNSTN